MVQQDMFSEWVQVVTALGALVFAAWQIIINERLKKLQDYVAVSIGPQLGFQLEVLNVGRSNLYLHKWEVGSLSETYTKPWLLPVEGKSKILIAIFPPQIGQHLAKFYLVDERGKKYLSSGEVVIEPVAVQLPPSTTPPQLQDNIPGSASGVQSVNIQLRMRAWSYKTEPYKWTI